MRALFASVLFSMSLAWNGAMANPITVRSGDHDGFTRLVLQLPEGVQWDVSGVPGRETIALDGHNSGFDVSRVFDVIPRDKLTNVAQKPSQLELELSCDCVVNSFLEQGNFLVVDIIDGPPLSVDTTTEAVSQFVVLEPESRFDFGELLWSETANVPGHPTPQEDSTDTAEESIETRDGSAAKIEQEIVEATRARLMEGLGEAASRGILRAATPDLRSLESTQEPTAEPQILDSSEQEILPTENQTGNMRVTTSRDILDTGDTFDLMTSGAICASPDSVQVHQWGDTHPFHSQISALRQELYSAVDRLDEEKAISLARLYVYFGFGAEAKQVLRLSENLVTANPELMDLADIIEFGFARNPRSVHRFADCDSELALWAIMAAKTLPEELLINEHAALRALVKLPIHLRSFIAPALSNRLTELGKLEAASIALRRVEQGDHSDAPDASLAQGRIKQRAGETEISDRILSEVGETKSKESPEALVAFVENRLADFEPVPADISLLIEAYAFELQDTSIGHDLLKAHVIASALSGQFTKAFEALENQTVRDNPNLSAELQSHVFSALVKTAEDFEFLDMTAAHFPENPNTLEPQAVDRVVERLHRLGFHDMASEIIAAIPPEQKTNQLTLVEASILLAAGLPQNTIDLLQDQSGDAAGELRARAFSALGDNQQAVQLFLASNMTEEAHRSAWLSENWVELADGQEEIFGDVRALAQTSVDSIEAENGMIAATQNALEESGSARNVLSDLLENVPVPP